MEGTKSYRNSSVRSKIREEEGEEAAPATKASIILWHMESSLQSRVLLKDCRKDLYCSKEKC